MHSNAEAVYYDGYEPGLSNYRSSNPGFTISQSLRLLRSKMANSHLSKHSKD